MNRGSWSGGRCLESWKRAPAAAPTIAQGLYRAPVEAASRYFNFKHLNFDPDKMLRRQETKNHWRSAEELRKVKDMNGQSIANCDCHNRNECYVNEPKCNIQKESLSKQPQRQVTVFLYNRLLIILQF